METIAASPAASSQQPAGSGSAAQQSRRPVRIRNSIAALIATSGSSASFDSFGTAGGHRRCSDNLHNDEMNKVYSTTTASHTCAEQTG